MIRGEVFRLQAPRRPRGRELEGPRFGVVVQADELLGLSTVIVAPTSRGAASTRWRPQLAVAGEQTRIVTEQLRAVSPDRLGDSHGLLSFEELREVDRALGIVLGLDVSAA
jgi:mRNA interferase MazF